MSKKIEITIEQLESLLQEQKQIVADELLGQSYLYNTESTDGHAKTIENIDREKFKKIAMSAGLPKDVKTLKRYL